MLIVPLQNIPTQSFSVQIDQIIFDFLITTCLIDNAQIQAITLTRDNVVIVSGQRAVSGEFIIPYQYLENGNFFISTENDEYPDYNKFGISQFLIYFSQSELNTLRA